MIIYPLTHTTAGFEFLQGTVPVVLSLMLVLMIIDTIIEARSHSKFKSELDPKVN